MRLAVFVDYDNLLGHHKSSGLLAVVTRALMLLPAEVQLKRGICDVRVYGGWYEGAAVTPLAEEIVVTLQKDFPAIIRVPRGAAGAIPIQTSAELAVALLEDPSFHMFNTYRKKGKPSNLRIQLPSTVGCIDASCPLPIARKLLKSGTCPVSSCAVVADDLVYRHEQKIVDTMLACDLVYSSRTGYDYLVLISGDDDFLPPLRTLLLRGSKVFRFHTRVNGPRAAFIAGTARLVEIDL